MIKTNKKIDYEAALTKLLNGLKFAEQKARSEEDNKYPAAYGRATMAIKMHIIACTDMSLNDIDREINPPQPENDIPDNLYQSPKAQ